MLIPYEICDLQILSSIHRWPFDFVDGVFLCLEAHLCVCLFFILLLILVSDSKSHPQDISKGAYHLHFLLKVLGLQVLQSSP